MNTIVQLVLFSLLLTLLINFSECKRMQKKSGKASKVERKWEKSAPGTKSNSNKQRKDKKYGTSSDTELLADEKTEKQKKKKNEKNKKEGKPEAKQAMKEEPKHSGKKSKKHHSDCPCHEKSKIEQVKERLAKAGVDKTEEEPKATEPPTTTNEVKEPESVKEVEPFKADPALCHAEEAEAAAPDSDESEI